MYYSPKTSTDGLVFHYDTGNTVRSFKGEPTTNQYTNPDFNNGTTGWTFGSWDGNISYTTATVLGPFGKDITALKLTKNNASSYSHFHQNNGGKYTTGNQYTLSAWVKGFGTLKGNSQWGGTHVNFTLTGDWQYVSYTVTAPNDSNYPYWAAEGITTGTVLYMTYAQSEQKSHVTPFVNGTRSSTQGLLDIAGNNSIDLANVSFSSTAQQVFDGTNDGISIMPNTTLFSNASFTVEAVLKSTATSSNRTFFSSGAPQGANQGIHLRLYPSSGLLRMGYYADDLNTAGGVITYGKYHHVVMQYDYDADQSKIYVDGQLKASGANGPYTAATATPSIGYWPSVGEYWLGELPIIKLYNRAISSDEVTRNYKALKSRFNLA